MFVDIEPGPEALEWAPEPDLYWEGWEPEPAQLWKAQALSWLLPGRRAMSPVHGEPGRFTYGNPAAEALADFMSGLDPDEFGEWFAMAMLGALFLRRWLRDHQAPPLPLLRRAFLVLLAVLRAISEPEPGRPGRADDPAIRGPSAPLVRARSILTAAPPSSRAPALAGAPA